MRRHHSHYGLSGLGIGHQQSLRQPIRKILAIERSYKISKYGIDIIAINLDRVAVKEI